MQLITTLKEKIIMLTLLKEEVDNSVGHVLSKSCVE